MWLTVSMFWSYPPVASNSTQTSLPTEPPEPEHGCCREIVLGNFPSNNHARWEEWTNIHMSTALLERRLQSNLDKKSSDWQYSPTSTPSIRPCVAVESWSIPKDCRRVLKNYRHKSRTPFLPPTLACDRILPRPFVSIYRQWQIESLYTSPYWPYWLRRRGTWL